MRKSLGQTSIEYMLMIAVSLGLGFIFLKKMNEYLIDNPNSYLSKYLNSFKSTIEQDSSGRYRVFNLPR